MKGLSPEFNAKLGTFVRRQVQLKLPTSLVVKKALRSARIDNVDAKLHQARKPVNKPIAANRTLSE